MAVAISGNKFVLLLQSNSQLYYSPNLNSSIVLIFFVQTHDMHAIEHEHCHKTDHTEKCRVHKYFGLVEQLIQDLLVINFSNQKFFLIVQHSPIVLKKRITLKIMNK